MTEQPTLTYDPIADLNALLPAKLTFKVEEVARLLDVSRDKMYEAVRSGQVRRVQVGDGAWRIPRPEVIRLLLGLPPVEYPEPANGSKDPLLGKAA